jgi:hypothetical protein
VSPGTWTPAWARVIATPAVKGTGFALLNWADFRTGADIRPGVALLMKASGIRSDKTVRDALRQMRDWGMVWRYREGSKSGRNGCEDEYRLTFPDDIGAIPMWPPDWGEPLPGLWITSRTPVVSTGVPAPRLRRTPVMSTGVPGYPQVLITGVPQAAPLIAPYGGWF